ncbi:MAG: flippase-like domain-containing protein [Candidatus Desulforudis sp.]|nr:flippase-like domain-containing protein [Desulforudis sp.]
MFRILVGLLILLGLAFVATRLTEGRQLLEVLGRGIPFWITIALILEALLRVNQIMFFHAVFQLFEVRLRFTKAAQLLLVNLFTSVAAPGGTLSGTAVVIAACMRQGIDPARAMIANFVYFLIDYTAFGLILAGAVVYLAQTQRIHAYEILATVLLAALVAGMFTLLTVALLRPRVLQRLGRRLETGPALLRRFRPDYSWDGRVTAWISDLVGALQRLRHHRGLVRPVVSALVFQTLAILTLASVFLAFQHPVSAAVLITGYAVGKLFTIISITPSGIGFVEGAMSGAFVSLGVPLETAVVVVLVYRGIDVWLPFLVGVWGVRVVARPAVVRNQM